MTREKWMVTHIKMSWTVDIHYLGGKGEYWALLSTDVLCQRFQGAIYKA